jgi:hypothetical protein
VTLRKKVLFGTAVAIACIVALWLPLALGLMAGFPFSLWTDDEVKPVGAHATFQESADCPLKYRYYRAKRDLGARLDGRTVAFCFPPQTAARKNDLIACFNENQRTHRENAGLTIGADIPSSTKFATFTVGR